MPKSVKISTAKVGMAPGTVVFTGQKKVDEVQIRRIRYGAFGLQETDVPNADELRRPDPDEKGVKWINVYGLHDTQLIDTLCKTFGVHPLAIEDIVAVGGRPLVMEYDGFLFASLKMLSQADDGSIVSEHLSLLMGPGWLLSFQERIGDVFEPLRNRIRQASTRIRERGADYLWYALMDAVVDRYLITMDALTQQVEELETAVWAADPPQDTPQRVQRLREEVNIMRRAVRPLREEVDTLIHDTSELLDPSTKPFFRDLQDHLHQLSESVEGLRETLSGIMDAHLSIVSMKMNEIMQVLTIMASIFIPLTFIAGIYGMNFEYMPELGVRWAYFAVWGVILAVGAGMLVYFRMKKWI